MNLFSVLCSHIGFFGFVRILINNHFCNLLLFCLRNDIGGLFLLSHFILCSLSAPSFLYFDYYLSKFLYY
uniref:Uncharacterized protein n=1 Tax=Rhizophora mucronata TaxID=61149 RepID=A0A2P2QJW3_RHIMU